jgi:hypothetical protein
MSTANSIASLALTGLAALSASHALAGQYLVFHTSHLSVRSPGQCPKPTLVLQEYETNEAAVSEARRLNKSDGILDQQTSVLVPGRYSIVYEYLSNSAMYPGCEFTKFGVVDGEDEEEANRRLKQRVDEYRSAFRSAPKTRQAWTGGELTKVRRDYDGVLMDFRSSRSSETTATVYAKVRNSRVDKAAFVVFQINGVFQKQSVLVDPGGTAGVPLGRDVRSFAVAVHFTEPEAMRPEGLVDIIKKQVREMVTIRNGRMKDDATNMPCMCVRN